MKNERLGRAILTILLAGFAVVATSCPQVLGNNNNGGGGDTGFTGVIFEEGLGGGLKPGIDYWNTNNNEASQDNDTKVVKSGSVSWKFTWTATTELWQGYAINAASSVSLTGFNALTFWAKAADKNVSVDRIGFGAEDNGLYQLFLLNTEIPHSDWKKFVLPLPNPGKLTAITNVFFIADGEGDNTVYLDDVKYEKLDGVELKSLASSNPAISVGSGGTVAHDEVPNSGRSQLSATYGYDGSDIVVYGQIFNFLEWSSGDPNVATVDSHGTVTGVTEAGGSTEVHGKLDDKSLTIDVTVKAKPNPADGTYVLYADNFANGFVGGVDSGNKAAKLNGEDATKFSEGSKSMSIDLTAVPETGETAWGGGFIGKDTVVDLSAFDTLEFSINLGSLDDATTPYLEFKIEDTGSWWETPTSFYSVDLYTLTMKEKDASGWRHYALKTSTFTNVNMKIFKSVGFWHPKTGGKDGAFQNMKYYVDNVRFTGSTSQ